MKQLVTLSRDKHTLEALKAYMVATLEQRVIKDSFKGENTEHGKACRDFIDEVFVRLKNDYEPKEEKVATSHK